MDIPVLYRMTILNYGTEITPVVWIYLFIWKWIILFQQAYLNKVLNLYKKIQYISENTKKNTPVS